MRTSSWLVINSAALIGIERGRQDGGEITRPLRHLGSLLEDFARPTLGLAVGRDELLERVRLPDSPPLLCVAGGETRGESRVGACRLAPSFDSSGGFKARHRGDEMAAGEVVRRRKRLAVRAVRALLGDRRGAERAADRDATERPRLPA